MITIKENIPIEKLLQILCDRMRDVGHVGIEVYPEIVSRFKTGEKALQFIKANILDNGCQWEQSKQDLDGDCGHGYQWTCDDCPINWKE